MSEKLESNQVTKYPPSRPGIVSFIVMGVMITAFVAYFVVFN